MNSKIEKLLNNRGGNYLFPFFWQHGDDETTLRTYMGVHRQADACGFMIVGSLAR